MDKVTAKPEARLLGEAVKVAAGLGLRLRIIEKELPGQGYRPDATVGLLVGGREVRYTVEIKRGLRPVTLGAVIHQLRTHATNPLLVADHVTPPLADALRAEGVEFIDAAGNAFLNRPPLFVFVKGQQPVRQAVVEQGRAFQPTGLQVLFALLARPELVGRPYREIAAAAGVAHGTVGWVMAELPHLGYLGTLGGRRRLMNGERLFDRWTEAYARTLRPRLLLGRFRGELPALQTRNWPGQVLVGGELAAARLTQHLRPGTATFYVDAVEATTVVKMGLRAADDGNVDFRRRFWTFPGDKEEQMAPTLLVYADLLAIGDARCLETAQLLRGPLLDRLG